MGIARNSTPRRLTDGLKTVVNAVVRILFTLAQNVKRELEGSRHGIFKKTCLAGTESLFLVLFTYKADSRDGVGVRESFRKLLFPKAEQSMVQRGGVL